MKNSTKNQIINSIKRIKPGDVFSAEAFVTDSISSDAARMALERMVAEGVIRKLGKGRYYKPEKTMFGELKPDVHQTVADLLEDKNHKITGYLTGTILFSQLGLTTQISSQIEIGVRKYRRAIKRGTVTISFVLQHNPITKENIPLLQLLDAIRFFREIPAATPNEAVAGISYLINQLKPEQQLRMISLALNYSPYVRALLGAILELSGLGEEQLKPLRSSLNAQTRYKLKLSQEILPTIANWNIQ